MKYTETPLNPQLLNVMQELKKMGLGPVDVMTVELSFARAELEKQYAYLNKESINVSKVHAFEIKFNDENTNIRVYFSDKVCESSTFGIYLHGGGWTFGNEKTHDGIARAFCKSSHLPIVSIGYTLAPDKKFPFQNDQIAFILENLVEILHQKFGITQDIVKFILIGDSAGANLAISSFQDYFTHSIRSKIIGMVLYYGVYSGDSDSDSWKRLGDGRYGLSSKAMNWYWKQYLQDIKQINLAQASPLFSSNTFFPPTQLIVGNLDPLLDDTINFANRLKRLNIAHNLLVVEGFPHGFLRFCNKVDDVYDIIKKSSLSMQQMANGVFQ